MPSKTYYEILGVEEDASKRTIQKKYRELALKYHPDKNKAPEAGKIFTELGEAYENLVDDHKRAYYDKDLKSRRETDSEYESESDYDSDGSRESTGTPRSSSGSDSDSEPKKQLSLDMILMHFLHLTETLKNSGGSLLQDSNESSLKQAMRTANSYLMVLEQNNWLYSYISPARTIIFTSKYLEVEKIVNDYLSIYRVMEMKIKTREEIRQVQSEIIQLLDKSRETPLDAEMGQALLVRMRTLEKELDDPNSPLQFKFKRDSETERKLAEFKKACELAAMPIEINNKLEELENKADEMWSRFHLSSKNDADWRLLSEQLKSLHSSIERFIHKYENSGLPELEMQALKIQLRHLQIDAVLNETEETIESILIFPYSEGIQVQHFREALNCLDEGYLKTQALVASCRNSKISPDQKLQELEEAVQERYQQVKQFFYSIFAKNRAFSYRHQIQAVDKILMIDKADRFLAFFMQNPLPTSSEIFTAAKTIFEVENDPRGYPLSEFREKLSFCKERCNELIMSLKMQELELLMTQTATLLEGAATIPPKPGSNSADQILHNLIEKAKQLVSGGQNQYILEPVKTDLIQILNKKIDGFKKQLKKQEEVTFFAIDKIIENLEKNIPTFANKAADQGSESQKIINIIQETRTKLLSQRNGDEHQDLKNNFQELLNLAKRKESTAPKTATARFFSSSNPEKSQKWKEVSTQLQNIIATLDKILPPTEKPTLVQAPRQPGKNQG